MIRGVVAVGTLEPEPRAVEVTSALDGKQAMGLPAGYFYRAQADRSRAEVGLPLSVVPIVVPI